MAELSLPAFLLLLLLYGGGFATAVVTNTTCFSCSPKNGVSANSTYQANLRSLLSTVPSSAAPFRFSNLSLGSAPDRVFALALCRGDTNSSTCLSCLATATSQALNICKGSLSAAVFYELCRLRFSNTRFFSTLTPNPPKPYFFEFEQVHEDPNYFRGRVGTLLANLRDRAAFGDNTGLYASGWIEYNEERPLYGMVQCTRDLSGFMCARCLEIPIRRITCCESSAHIIYQGGSCYLSYAFFLFFNGSVAAPPLLPRPAMVSNVSAHVHDVGAPPEYHQQRRG